MFKGHRFGRKLNTLDNFLCKIVCQSLKYWGFGHLKLKFFPGEVPQLSYWTQVAIIGTSLIHRQPIGLLFSSYGYYLSTAYVQLEFGESAASI